MPTAKEGFLFLSTLTSQAGEKAGDFLRLCSAPHPAHCHLVSIDLVPSVLGFACQEAAMSLTTLCKPCGLFKCFILSVGLQPLHPTPGLFPNAQAGGVSGTLCSRQPSLSVLPLVRLLSLHPDLQYKQYPPTGAPMTAVGFKSTN